MSNQIIKTNICDFVSFSFVNIKKEVNHHLTASIKGYINEENYGFATKFSPTKIVKLKDEHGNPVMSGNISKLLFTKENDLWFMELDIISLTQVMDNNEHIRTFQDSEMTYGDVADTVNEESGLDYTVIIPNHNSDSISKMFVQYKETDWEFLQRVTSRLNTYIIADHKPPNPSILIGLPTRSTNHTVTPEKFTIMLDAQEMRKVPNKGQSDCTYLYFDDRTHYDLADILTINSAAWLVWKVDSNLIKGEIIHSYILKKEGAFVQNEYFNDKIIGAELTGNITEVDRKLVQLDLHNDVKKRTYRWFDYATVYSSPGDIGWYFMPELGSRSRITFPTEKEFDAFVSSAVHEGARDNEDIKSIRTPYSQEIVFAPGYIRIADPTSEILFDEESGLKFQSRKDISISAANDISVVSQGKIDIHTESRLTMTQPGSIINIEENIDIISDHVRIK